MKRQPKNNKYPQKSGVDMQIALEDISKLEKEINTSIEDFRKKWKDIVWVGYTNVIKDNNHPIKINYCFNMSRFEELL